MKNLADIGKTIFLTTHFMDEAQYLADRVAVIAKGEIVAEGTPATIAGRDRMQTRIQVPPARGHAARARAHRRDALADGSWEVRTDNPTKVVHDLTAWALERGHVTRCSRSRSRASRTSTSS